MFFDEFRTGLTAGSCFPCHPTAYCHPSARFNVSPIRPVQCVTYPPGSDLAIAQSGTDGTERLRESVILLPLSRDIAVDANRDGTIEFAGNAGSGAPPGDASDQTAEDRPFRFWLNDDDDRDEADHPGSSRRDCADDQIQSGRDLEDFARLHIYIGGLHAEFVSGALQIGFEWKDTGGTAPAIKAYGAAENGGGDQYLQTPIVAANQATGAAGTALGTVAAGGSFKLPPSFWGADVLAGRPALGADAPNRYLLFEGVAEGKGRLALTIWKDGKKIGDGPGVWLELKDVRRMYQRAKARPENIAAPQESVSGPFSGPAWSVSDDWNWPFEPAADEGKRAVIFVHGWSMDYNSYLSFAETMFKRLWHRGFKGRYCTLRWDPLIVAEAFGDPDLPVGNGEYNRSEHRAWVYGASLKGFAETLRAEDFAVSLIGHSMGNIVCGSALRRGLAVDNYLLMQAAVPAGCYDAGAAVNGYDKFWLAEADDPTPDYHLAPDGAATKGYRGFLAGIGDNAGRIVNFHNLDDFALATGDVYFGTLNANWEANQEKYKPDGNAATVWHYFYFPDRENVAERARLRVDYLNGRDVTDSYEMKAFVARPRSKAAGAVDESLHNLPGGAITANVDLQDYGFAGDRHDHSGQFDRNIHEVGELYSRIINFLQPASVP